MENQAATAMQTEQHLQKDLPTGHGLTSQTVDLTNEVFEFFKLNFAFWNSGLTDDQIRFKKMQWAQRIQAHTPDRVREAMNKTVESLDDKGGPTIAAFMQNLIRRPEHQPFYPEKLLPPPKDTDEKISARRAVQHGFAARFDGFTSMVGKFDEYTGDFPVDDVVMAIAVPVVEHPRNHKKILRDQTEAWRKLHQAFNEVWDHLHG